MPACSAHGDLDVVDEVAVPQRLDHQVGKAEYQQVLHRLLGKVVIDAIDLLLVEVAVHQLIQSLRTFQIHAERLLNHKAVQASRPIQARRGKIAGDGAEVLGLDREIKHDIRAHAGLGLAEFLEQTPERPGILKVAAHVAETRSKSGETFRGELLSQIRTQCLVHVRFPVHIGPFPARKRDEVGHLRQPAFEFKAIERGQQLGCGEMSSRSEDHETAGKEIALGIHVLGGPPTLAIDARDPGRRT